MAYAGNQNSPFSSAEEELAAQKKFDVAQTQANEYARAKAAGEDLSRFGPNVEGPWQSLGAPMPNYSGGMTLQAPTTQGFTTLNPATGQPNMLPYITGSGAGIFNQVMSDPNRLGSLFGKAGASTALKATMPAPGPGGTGAPLDGPGGGPGGNPSAITGPGGANPTPGPNPLPGVDPSGQLPSYILNQFGSNIAGALRGELPEDVQNLLAQQSAEYGVGSGTQGSQFQGYRGLRNLGLTSLDRMKQAEDLIAGQFTKPSEKIALDQHAKELADLQARADRAYGLDKQKLEAELKLERDKFAEQVNQFNRQMQQSELQALGMKYPTGATAGSGGFTLGGTHPRFSALEPGSSGYWDLWKAGYI